MIARLALLVSLCCSAAAQTPAIRTLRVPDGGIQPQAVVAEDGTLHLLYYKGDPKAGDLYYVTRTPGKSEFAKPIRVNSQTASAVAMGNDRGGQLALGKNNRPHVAWNGSGKAQPRGPKDPSISAENEHNGLPMLYARLNDKGDAFEPQRNVMTASFALDGGGSIAADKDGHVCIVFHAAPVGVTSPSETARLVFAASSGDDGATFTPERPVSRDGLGACACCGLKALIDSRGNLRILFRSASSLQDRDAILLSTELAPELPRMRDKKLDAWQIQSCPMSTFAFSQSRGRVYGAWETAGQVFVAVANNTTPEKVPAPGDSRTRKYPSLACNKDGTVLLAWTEDMSWSKGGTAHWQLYSPDLKPIEAGSPGPIPAWSLIAAFPEPDGSFTVIY